MSGESFLVMIDFAFSIVTSVLKPCSFSPSGSPCCIEALPQPSSTACRLRTSKRPLRFVTAPRPRRRSGSMAEPMKSRRKSASERVMLNDIALPS